MFSQRSSAVAIDTNAWIMLMTGTVSKPQSAVRGKAKLGEEGPLRKCASSGVDGSGVGIVGKSGGSD